MADKVEKVGRPMKFPYTLSAKIAQFPFKFYYNNNWLFKYYIFGLVVSLPVFMKISKLGNTLFLVQTVEHLLQFFYFIANSPGNVAKWAEMKKKEAAEHH